MHKILPFNHKLDEEWIPKSISLHLLHERIIKFKYSELIH